MDPETTDHADHEAVPLLDGAAGGDVAIVCNECGEPLDSMGRHVLEEGYEAEVLSDDRDAIKDATVEGI